VTTESSERAPSSGRGKAHWAATSSSRGFRRVWSTVVVANPGVMSIDTTWDSMRSSPRGSGADVAWISSSGDACSWVALATRSVARATANQTGALFMARSSLFRRMESASDRGRAHPIDFESYDNLCYMIQLHRLEGFYWVAKTGGYARAARAFPYPITQPAVHQQVKKLEVDLGVKLFERVAKDRMRLTPSGRQLHAFAAPFFDQLPAVVRAIQASDFAGEIRIRAANMLLRDLMPAWVRRLRRSCPGAEIHLGELGSPDVSSLLSGEADLLVNHLPDVPDEIAVKQVATLHGFLVVSKDHRLAKRRQAKLAEIGDDTFITYTPGLLAHHLQVRALHEHGVMPERTISAGTASAILGLVEAGLGVSAIATLDQEGPRRRGVVALPLVRPRVALSVMAAWRRGGPSHPVLEAALETAPRP